MGFEFMARKKRKHTNRLQEEKSPYLLQHAHNPVDWYPWSEAAFKKAKKEDKPIFLSIGYSTCHWCHVMAHESFENEQVATLMNDTFINVKVDREERPDIDSLYMSVAQMMTGSGGWPLTIIMTPDKQPFFAATYIPRESRFGQLGMLELIPQIQQLWKNQRARLTRITEEVKANLIEETFSPAGVELDEGALEMTFDQLSGRFDEAKGGFSFAPKFPTPHNLSFLLRYWKRTQNTTALQMVEKTLQEMRQGGIYDHIGFGFHRYSSDSKWLLPHFEKMLYDQAMLTIAYIEAFQATGKEEYAQTAQEVLGYVLRDMTHPDGGFYSAEDADSEGEEGKFYVWTLQEIQEVLGKKEGEFFAKIFNFKDQGNFTDEATGHRPGTNIPHLKAPISDIAKKLKVTETELVQRLEQNRQKLFLVREKRIHPHKDDKILTDWNGLMISAFSRAGRILDKPEYVDAAKRAANFILSKLRDSQGRLLHRFRDGEAAVLAFLDDYAFFLWGLLELYESTFEPHFLKSALELYQDMHTHFWDETNGGFYFTADDAEQLLVRKKDIYDGAIPSGNSVAMLVLLRLGGLTAKPEFQEQASKISKAFSTQILQMASAYGQMMIAVDYAIGPSFEIVIVGEEEHADTQKMVRTLRSRFNPNQVVLFISEKQKGPILKLAPFAFAYSAVEGKPTAYVCVNHVCQQPTTEIKQMLKFLNSK
jgi:uncharacterized protein YyaL (SSP411 family)